ncbi:MAG: stage III sporulation protein AF [Firmicutes bacterium]|nr:stage III sporulation protein AF [Bacillota bacterium]
MYELIHTWTQQLVFLILFVTVVEMILPAGELRRYTKMILGLVVILAILDPLLHFVRGPGWMSQFPDVPAMNATAGEDAAEAGRQMFIGAARATQAGLFEEVRMEIETIDGVQQASVHVVEGQPQINVSLKTTAVEADVTERVRLLARSFFGVNNVVVRVEAQRGGQ